MPADYEDYKQMSADGKKLCIAVKLMLSLILMAILILVLARWDPFYSFWKPDLFLQSSPAVSGLVAKIWFD